MNLLKIDIKEKEILKVEIENNYKPYAFVIALYIIVAIGAYHTTWMYPATLNRRLDELTTILIIVCTSIYLSRK